MGMTRIKPPAAKAPQATPLASIRLAIAMGAVCTDLLRVNIRAKRNSFQASRALRIAAEAAAGVLRGKVIRKTIPNWEQPSILALSSISIGMVDIYPLIIHMAKGSVKDV